MATRSRIFSSLVLGICLFTAIPSCAEEVVQTISWDKLADEGRINPHFAVMIEDGFAIVTASNENSEAANMQLISIDTPAITEKTWAIRGSVSYKDVQKDSFIEMSSSFGNGERYFSRALAEEGLLAGISGSSDWRPFVLPFFANEDFPPLERLELNIHFEGTGAISFRPLEIVEYKAGEDPLGSESNAWWSNRQAGIYGGIFGGLIGMCGTLAGILTAFGKSRRFVGNLLRAMTVIGMLAVIFAIVALRYQQPYAVWYPMALLGFVSAMIGIVLSPIVCKVYKTREKRSEN